MPMIMCSACMPVSAKCRTMKIRTCEAMGERCALCDTSKKPAAGNSVIVVPSGR